MSILSIIIVLIFLVDEILAYRVSSKDYSKLSKSIKVFEVKKWVSLLTLILFVAVNGVISYFHELLTIYDIIFMLILDITVLMKLYKSVGKVIIYDEGILVKGILIHWSMIDDISEYENGNFIISSLYLSGNAIKTGIIKDREGFKALSHEKYIHSRTDSGEEPDETIDKPFFGIIAEVIIKLRGDKKI